MDRRSSGCHAGPSVAAGVAAIALTLFQPSLAQGHKAAQITVTGLDPASAVGSPGSRREPFIRDAATHPGEARPSRIAMVHRQPSVTGSTSAFARF